MAKLGYQPIPMVGASYRNPPTGIEIYDAHEDNIIFDKAGNMIPFDVWVNDPNGVYEAEVGKGDGQRTILKSAPAPERDEADLYAGMEESLFGPRAKAKENALNQARKAPEKGRENIAKRVAKMEGLADLDLFAAAAKRTADATPKESKSSIRKPVSKMDIRNADSRTLQR